MMLLALGPLLLTIAGVQAAPGVGSAADATAHAASDAARQLDRQASESARARLERQRRRLLVDPSFYRDPPCPRATPVSGPAARAASCPGSP